MTNSADSAIRTKGSLCTGTGSLDDAVPGQLSWYSENEPLPAHALKLANPGVPNFGDLTTTDWNYRQHHVDLLTSGDPCQSLSAAGLQLASGDVRFLWPNVIDAIRKIHPLHIFLENVQNVVTVPLVKGGERGTVLKMRLDDLRAAGYAVRWTVLGACAVGAPHHRHRWFLRGRYVGANAPEAERVVMKCGAPRGGQRQLLPTPTTADGKGGPGAQGRDGGLNLRTAVTLLPTPTVADARNTRNATANGGAGSPGNPGWTLADVGHDFPRASTVLPTPRATDGVNGGPNQRGRKGDLAMGSAVQMEHWGKFGDAIALWEQITGVPAPAPTVPAPRGGMRLNPALSEWMMGYRPGQITTVMDRNDALKAIGNGVVSIQARAAWDLLKG
jgi:DNA (cytosine-5)-methyltransferase 1